MMQRNLVNILLLYLIYTVYTTTATSGNRRSQYYNETDIEPGYFLYYAYGSNLYSNRLHINIKSAKFYDIAELKGWRLAFYKNFKQWNGAVATIEEDPKSIVWGTIWQIKNEDMPLLDEQESVNDGWYYVKNVKVMLKTGAELSVRTYIETLQTHNNETLPSLTYQMVIVLGAMQYSLPTDYINNLMSYQNNGLLAPKERRKELGCPFYDETAETMKSGNS